MTNSKHWERELLEIMYRNRALICLTSNLHFLFKSLFRCNNWWDWLFSHFLLFWKDCLFILVSKHWHRTHHILQNLLPTSIYVLNSLDVRIPSLFNHLPTFFRQCLNSQTSVHSHLLEWLWHNLNLECIINYSYYKCLCHIAVECMNIVVILTSSYKNCYFFLLKYTTP